MSGKPINPEQVKLYMKECQEGKSQITASSKSGIFERFGRRIEHGDLQPFGNKKRYWRTSEQTPLQQYGKAKLFHYYQRNRNLPR